MAYILFQEDKLAQHGSLIVWSTYDSSHTGQADGHVIVSDTSLPGEGGYGTYNAVAALSFSNYRGVNRINMIQTRPEYRNKGLGEMLVDGLVKEAGGYGNIRWGLTTPDGERLKARMDKKYGAATAENMDPRVADRFPPLPGPMFSLPDVLRLQKKRS